MPAVIVLSLALGTGANAAVYSAIDALLFQPPPGVAAPATLADVYTSQVNGGSYGPSSLPDYDSMTSLPGLQVAAVADLEDQTVRIGDRTTSSRVAAVTPNFWEVLRMNAFAGAWVAGDVVLGFDAWQALGGDVRIVGRGVSVGGQSYRVAAIAPRGFRGLHLDRVYDVWIPIHASEAGSRGDRHLRLVARLGTAGIDAAQAELSSLSVSLARAHPATNRGTIRNADEPRRFLAAAYSRLDPAMQWRTRLLAAAVLGATALMLLGACVNTGSLLLSRGIARRSELAIKAALGADRGRLVRQMVLESVLLSGLGTAAGVLAAAWSAAAIPALFAPDHARLLDTRVQPPVIAVTLGVGLLTGLVCGLGPALLATRRLAADALRGDASRIGERHGHARARMVMVGAQLALAAIFLIGAALLSSIVDTALGRERSPVSGEVTIAAIESYDPDYRARAYAELRRLQDVSAVGWVTTPPMARQVRRVYQVRRGETSEPIDVDVAYASSDYFQIMGMLVVEGRLFTAREAAGADAAVLVNEALSDRYFAGAAAGKTLIDARGHVLPIAGVVRTRTYRAFAGPVVPMVFYPIELSTGRAYAAVVRARSYASGTRARIEAALNRAGTPSHLEVLSFDDYLARALAADRLIARLAAACGVASLALAVIGVYGIVGDLVRRRAREIGLRIALGASPWRVLQTLLGSGVAPAVAGIAAGIFAAAVLLRVARSFVYEVPELGLGLALATSATLITVVAAAVLPHARRALRVNPVTVLRQP